jgi:hypothetical protein
MFRPTFSDIIRRYYKDRKGKTDRTKVEASALVLSGWPNRSPKHVTYMRNKLMLEQFSCCICPITIEDTKCSEQFVSSPYFETRRIRSTPFPLFKINFNITFPYTS